MNEPGTKKAEAGDHFTVETVHDAYEPGGKNYALNPDNPDGGPTPVLGVGQRLVVVEEEGPDA